MHYNSIIAGAAYVRIALNDAALEKGLKEAQKRVRGFAKTWEILKSKMGLAGSDAFVDFSNVIQPMISVINNFKKFNDQIFVLKAISGASKNEIAEFEKHIRHLGATTAFTAEEVAKGAVELSRMGFSTNEVKAGLKPALDLVRATGQETFRLGEISAYAASAVRIFGLQGKDFADVCDVMAYAANASNADIDDLGEALKIAGPSARTVNEDLRDTAAALMLLSNAGVKGSLAGTSLRKIYQSLAAQSGKTEGLTAEEIEDGIRGIEQFSALGVSIIDAQSGNLRKVADIIVDLAKAVKNFKTGEKINFATDVFDLRGSLGALTLLNDPNMLVDFREQLTTTTGYASQKAREMEEGIGGAIRKLRASFTELQLVVGNIVSVAITPLIQSSTRWLQAVAKWVEQNKVLVTSFSAIIASGLVIGSTMRLLALVMQFLQNALTPVFTFALALEKIVLATAGMQTALTAVTGAKAAYLAVLGKLSTAELIAAASSAKHATAILQVAFADLLAVRSTQSLTLASMRLIAAKTSLIALEIKNAIVAKKAALVQAFSGKTIRTSILAIQAWLVAKAKEIVVGGAAALGSGARTAAYILEIIAIKGLATATTFLSLAFTALMAHPVIAFLVAVGAGAAIAYAWFLKESKAAVSAAQGIAKLTKAEAEYAKQRTSTVTDVANKSDLYIKRLNQLAEISKERKLVQAELNELQKLQEKLSSLGVKFTINIDADTGIVSVDEDLAKKVENSIEPAVIDALKKEETTLQNSIKKNNNALGKIEGADNSDEIRANLEQQIGNDLKRLQEVQARLQAIRSGDIDALYGREDQTRQRTEEYEQRRIAATKELADAKEKINEIEEENIRKSRSAYQNEIADIRKTREEYKKNINLLIEQEKAKKRINERMGKSDAAAANEKEIQALTQKLEAADAAFDAQEKNAAIKKEQQLKKYAEFEADVQKENAEKELERKQKAEIDAIKKSGDVTSIRKKISEFLNSYKQELSGLWEKYRTAYANARAEDSEYGDDISEQEKTQLEELMEEINKRREKISNYESQLDAVQDHLRSATLGSFSFDVLKGMFGQDSAAERTANAAEEQVRNQKNTNKYMKSMLELLDLSYD